MDPIRFALPWPPSNNNYWRHVGKVTLLSKAGRMYRMTVALMMRQLGVTERGLITGRLHVRLLAYPPDQRARDLDNLPKAVLDSITHAGLWEDDSQIDHLEVVRLPQRDKLGALVVEILPMAGAAVLK